MFCTKCGANNGDNNVFCKNCGAKLVKPLTNNQGVSDHSVLVSQSTPNNSGAARTAKSVNVKLIAGLAVVVIVIAVAVGILMNVGKGGKTLFEQVKLGKTSAADVEKYFDTNDLGYDWGFEEIEDIPTWIFYSTMIQNFVFSISRDYVYDNEEAYHEYIASNMHRHSEFINETTLHHNLSDTLWGADCKYFVTVSGDVDVKDKRKKTSCVSCAVVFNSKTEEREFRQGLNDYLKKHQKTKLENKQFDSDGIYLTVYPLEKVDLNGEKALTCLIYDYSNLDEGCIFIELCAEKYYTEEDLNNIMMEVTPFSDDHFYEPDDNFLYQKEVIGWYFGFTINEMYPEFREEELKKIAKEVPEFECSFMENYTSLKNSGINIESCTQNAIGDIDIPEKIQDYPVKAISDNAFSDCTRITSIKIPNGVVEIGGGTFSGCSSLTSITIPNGVTRIGSKAFANCSNLTSINIPDSVIGIADDAFDGCDKLVSDELISRFPNAVPKPSWLEAYREYADSGSVCLMDFKHSGTPYLVIDTGCCEIYHCNGTEVTLCLEASGIYCEYSLKNNKLSVYGGTAGSGWASATLINMDTFEEELYYYTEAPGTSQYGHNWDKAIYEDRNGEISKEEYERIKNEIEHQMSDGKSFEMYGSVNEAYQAYISNEPNTSTSSETPAADVQIPAPAETIPAVPAETAPAEPVSEYILEDSNSRYLTKSDLQGLSADECRIARNEIYARYGRKFNDEELQSYFNSCSWYHGTIEPDDFQESMLNDYEIENKNLIVEYEKEMGYR